MLIAIDTSTDTAGVALAGEDGVIAEFNWRCGQNHSVQLLPNLSFVLARVNLKLSDANGIIVARGPGGYNGLRVGIATAKSLAFSLNVPVAGIGTLEAMAFEHAAYGLPVCAAVNPGGPELAAALFETKDGVWQRSLPEQMISAEELCRRIGGKTIFCGQIPGTAAAVIREKLGEKAVFMLAAEDWTRTGALIELGRRRFGNKDFDDPASLQPLYLRGPSITQSKHS